MDKSGLKTLATFFIVVIAFIVFFWYRSENAKVKTIEKLQDQISEYEETIDDLRAEIDGLKEQLGE